MKAKLDKVIACFEPPPKPPKRKLGKEWFVTWRNQYINSTKHAVLAAGQWGDKARSLCGKAELSFFQCLAYGETRCKTCERLVAKLGVRTV